MAAVHIFATVVALAVLHFGNTVSGHYGGLYEDEYNSMSRMSTPNKYRVDTYTVTRYLPSTTNKTVRDCDRALMTHFEVQFSAVRSRLGSVYLAHIVSKEERNCFKDRFNSTNGMTFSQCLENAVKYSAQAFHYDQVTTYCNLYSNWRKHKFRTCKRGEAGKEGVYYLQYSQPSGFRPCSGVQVVLKSAYTAGGSNVKVTASFKKNYCCCEITRISFDYLGTTNLMSIPGYTYTYPTEWAAKQAWRNHTTVTVYAEGAGMIALTEYTPDDDL